MGGSVGRVVAVAAAVAVPFAAPTIASSIGLSSTIAGALGRTAGNVLGSAIVGAGLGSVAAVVSGQPISRGATTGFIGGGIGGFLGGGPEGAATAADGSVITDAGLGTAESTLGNVDAARTASTSPFATIPGSEQTAMLGAQQAAFEPATLGERLSAGLQTVGSTALEKISDPETVANFTLRAASNLLATSLIPDSAMSGLSPEEQTIVDARQAELEQLRQTNRVAFDEQIKAAGDFLVQANQLDPVYFANQFANAAKIKSARGAREARKQFAFDNPNQALTQADINRQSLDTFRESSAAYDTGFNRALQNQTGLRQAGANIFGNITGAGNTYLTGLRDLQTDLAVGRTAGDKARSNLVSEFAGLNTGLGFLPDEEEDEVIA